MKEIIIILYNNYFWLFITSVVLFVLLIIYLKSKWYKSYWKIWFLLFSVSITLWLSNWILKHYSDNTSNQWTWYIEETTGAINIVEQFAWDYTISIWENIEEAINSWVRGKDFISIVPTEQPNINQETKTDNNKIIRTYLSKYKSEFIIPETKTNWYVIFVTSKEIIDDRWLFLGVRWKSEWEMKKSKFIDIGKPNWYAYDMKNVWVGNYKNWLNLFDLSRNWKIQVWGVVSENGNKVEEIIMVFY